jgi:hypothetical protein
MSIACTLAEMCRQLAFQAAGDNVTFDVVVLAYSLITYDLELTRLDLA